MGRRSGARLRTRAHCGRAQLPPLRPRPAAALHRKTLRGRLEHEHRRPNHLNDGPRRRAPPGFIPIQPLPRGNSQILMRRIAVLAFVVAVAGAGLYYGERSKAETSITPAPLMHVIGDAEREATRVPMSMTRLSDDQEIEAGNRIADGYVTSLSRSSNPQDDAVADYVERVGRMLAAQAH